MSAPVDTLRAFYQRVMQHILLRDIDAALAGTALSPIQVLISGGPVTNCSISNDLRMFADMAIATGADGLAGAALEASVDPGRVVFDEMRILALAHGDERFVQRVDYYLAVHGDGAAAERLWHLRRDDQPMTGVFLLGLRRHCANPHRFVPFVVRPGFEIEIFGMGIRERVLEAEENLERLRDADAWLNARNADREGVVEEVLSAQADAVAAIDDARRRREASIARLTERNERKNRGETSGGER